MGKEEDLEITLRVARYAYDRLTFAGPIYAVAAGTATVWSIAALEGSLYLMQHHARQQQQLQAARFVTRYATYNVLPSLIWGTQSPSTIVASSPALSSLTKASTPTWLYSATSLPPQRALNVILLTALRGAVAGSVVLSNVIAVTTLWQRAREDYAARIERGREPPLGVCRRRQPVTIRLAGVHSDVTTLSMERRKGSLWPVFEDSRRVQPLVWKYGKRDSSEPLPSIPMYWQVDSGEYSRVASWNGMRIPKSWLFPVKDKKMLLYLEADGTTGDESALSLAKGEPYFESTNRFDRNHPQKRSSWWGWLSSNRRNEDSLDQLSTHPFPDLDLDLREVTQGFRRLSELAQRSGKCEIEVMRVLLVDPTLIVESGGGRQTTVRGLVEELGLADVIVDARASVLHAILEWLKVQYISHGYQQQRIPGRLKPVILETPSKAWFQSIRSELQKHGYEVIDRAQATNDTTPMLIYEQSSADTIHTIRQYLERGIIKDPTRVCALLTCFDGLDEISSLHETYGNIGHVCSSDIHDRALEWVRRQRLMGVTAAKIQEDLDAGKAWG